MKKLSFHGGEVYEYLSQMTPNMKPRSKPLEEMSSSGSVLKAPQGGMKYDGGKNIAGVLLEDFPNALDGVCSVATFGANKYARSSWQGVPNGLQRYQDAMMRHLLAHGKGEKLDPESGLPHLWHIAWNSLAIIELSK